MYPDEETHRSGVVNIRYGITSVMKNAGCDVGCGYALMCDNMYTHVHVHSPDSPTEPLLQRSGDRDNSKGTVLETTETYSELSKDNGKHRPGSACMVSRRSIGVECRHGECMHIYTERGVGRVMEVMCAQLLTIAKGA